MIGRDTSGKLKWRDQGISGLFLFYIFYLFLIMVGWCLGWTLGSQDDLVCLTTWQFLQSRTMKPCWYTLAHHHYESFLLAELTSLEIRFTLPFNLVAWTLWSLLLELGPGREEVNNQNLKPAKRMKFFMIFLQVDGHKPHFPHPAPVQLLDHASSEAQIDFVQMLLGSVYGLGQVAVSFSTRPDIPKAFIIHLHTKHC